MFSRPEDMVRTTCTGVAATRGRPVAMSRMRSEAAILALREGRVSIFCEAPNSSAQLPKHSNYYIINPTSLNISNGSFFNQVFMRRSDLPCISVKSSPLL